MKTLSVLCSLLLLVGCARLNSVHRLTDVNDNISTLAIDAKQRFLIANTLYEFDDKGNPVSYPAFCAEPSPDAFAVYSAALETNASEANQLTAALKAVTGESAGTMGVRTEAIQLMRDAMYRLCESYVSGGITKVEYAKMVVKYQKSMVTLIAIEQLTGAAQPAQLVLNSGATLALNDGVLKAKESLDKARQVRDETNKKLSSINKNLDEKKSALGNDVDKSCPNGVGTNDETKQKCSDYFAAIKERDKIKSELSAKAKSVLEWQQVFEKATASLNMTTQATHEAIKANSREPNDASKVALYATVKSMVEDVFLDDAINTCITQFAKFTDQYISPYKVSEEKSVTEFGEFIDDKKALFNICNTLLTERYNRQATTTP